MISANIERKLTTILSADVQGFSRLMGADEEATLHTRPIDAPQKKTCADVASDCGPESYQGVAGLPLAGAAMVASTPSMRTPILPGCTWNVSVCPARSTTSVRGPSPG